MTDNTRSGLPKRSDDPTSRISRGSRLYLLRQAVMPDEIDGVSVPRTRQSRMLAVLRVVDDHARARSSVCLRIQTVAKCLLVSRRTVERAIGDLESAGLLAVRRQKRRDGGRGASEYTIDWQAFRALQPEDATGATMRQVDASPRHTVNRVRHGDATSRQADAGTMRQTDATIDRLPDRISSPPPPPERGSTPESVTPPVAGEPVAEGVGVEFLKGIRLDVAAAAGRTAAQRNFRGEQVGWLCEAYQAARDSYQSPGIVKHWIETRDPEDIVAGWRPAGRRAVSDDREREATIARLAAEDEHARIAADEQKALDALEDQYGDEIDDVPIADLAQLVPEGPARRKLLQSNRWRSRFTRGTVLRHWHSERTDGKEATP